MLELIGKEYSIETNKLKNFLDKKKIKYTYIDIEFNEKILYWIKANKIISLPILKKGKLFVIGYNEKAIKKILNT